MSDTATDEKKDYLEPWLITWVTHNSRVSERMVRFGVKKGNPIILSRNDEIDLTRYMKNIVLENELKVISFNICRDHVHVIIVCRINELSDIVRKLKGKLAYLFNKSRSLSGALWAQKFNRRLLDDFDNAVDYVVRNREIHELTRNKCVESLVSEFVMSEEEAFSKRRED